MSTSYYYDKDFTSKQKAKTHASKRRATGRKSIVKHRSIGGKKHYFVYTSKPRKRRRRR